MMPKKLNHPPIPPKCDFFQKRYFEKTKDGTWIFSVWNSSMEPLDIDFTAPGFNFKSPWKQIIAAVARCAWLDEAARLALAAIKEKYVSGYWTDYSHEEMLAELEPQYPIAIDNAAAWRAWGEK